MPLLVPRQSAIQADKCFLNNVLGVVGVVQHPARKPQTSWVIRLHDGRERVDIAKLCPAYRRRVDGGGLSRSLQSDCSRRWSLDIRVTTGLTGVVARRSLIQVTN